MDFMHQTVASTIVKYFTWLFDNDGILDITHAFISYNVLVFGIAVVCSFYNISNGVQGVQTRLKRKDRFESK